MGALTRMTSYCVTAVDANGSINENTYTYSDLPYPHSAHLVDIMRHLDDAYLTLKSVEVVI